nr:type I-E CRISPR-associated protein Cas5/CasD [Limobrevibacterium gyesilva]
MVFVLHGPMAAFGGVAVGERRGGEMRPGRSALLGLLSAALGIERTAAATHAAMERGYGVAVRVDAPGVALSDYHTAQVPPARRGEHHATRRAELDARPLETILSRREYRTDSLYTVAAWARAEAPVPLADLADALLRPNFTLSIGRKSCPLGLPPGPVVVAAADPLAAMEARPVPIPEQIVRSRLRARPVTLATDLDGIPDGIPPRWIETRRDSIASRDRWQFSLRQEAVIGLPLPASVGATP